MSIKEITKIHGTPVFDALGQQHFHVIVRRRDPVVLTKVHGPSAQSRTPFLGLFAAGAARKHHVVNNSLHP
jgi:hypothetical protein